MVLLHKKYNLPGRRKTGQQPASFTPKELTAHFVKALPGFSSAKTNAVPTTWKVAAGAVAIDKKRPSIANCCRF